MEDYIMDRTALWQEYQGGRQEEPSFERFLVAALTRARAQRDAAWEETWAIRAKYLAAYAAAAAAQA